MDEPKKPIKNQSQIVIDLDNALVDIIKQYIHIMQKVKMLCPKDFTENQIELIFIRSEATYNNLLIKFYKDQLRKQKESSENTNNEYDVSII